MSDIQFERVERKTISEEVRTAIAARITSHELPPGSRLPSERALCEQFGVARTSVREAIQGLVSIGLIERRANRAYVVERLPQVQLDGHDGRKRRVRELFEVRQVVEVPIARLTACRAADEQRTEIARLAEQFAPDMSLESFRRLDRDFHWAIAVACGNATLAEVYGKILASLFQSTEFDELLGAQSNRQVVREIIRNASEAHRAIARGITEADWSVVVEAAEMHLDQVEDQMISKLV
jgi:GntR family transcriptional repressor for pyruvate dehydrogenase complex